MEEIILDISRQREENSQLKINELELRKQLKDWENNYNVQKEKHLT